MWKLETQKEEITAAMKLTARNRSHNQHHHHPSSSSSPANSGGSPSSPSHSSSAESRSDNNETTGEYDKLTRRPNKHHHQNDTTFRKRIWYRWKLLNMHSKVLTAAIITLLLQHTLLGVWDQCFHRIGFAATANENASQEKEFAVVINTYKRPDMLRQAIQHYAGTCGKRYRVGQVFVVWAEQGVELPTPESFFDGPSLRHQSTTSNNRSPVHVLQMSKDSLNSRFEPISQLQTTSVFMVDDDIRVSCPSLLLAFQAWKSMPDTMVGYYPRLSSKPLGYQQASSPTTALVYHAWPIVYWRNSFNLVLTKASFLHSKYLELYTNDDTFPKEIKEHVDRHMNCEDIAMSMLVANYTKYLSSTGTTAVRPIYVEGQVTDLGLFGGISTGSGHMTTRSDCLTQLTSIFRQHGWEEPFDYEYTLSESSWIRHAPGFWWQNSPSNVFEWFAFANTFT